MAAAAIYASEEQPVIVGTAGGSRIHGLLQLDTPLLFRGAQGRQPLDLGKIKRLTFGRRPDLNLENDARLALGDMGSENFLVRAKAAARLRQLGPAAARTLRHGMLADDSHIAIQARWMLGAVSGRNAVDLSADTLLNSEGKTVEGELLQGEVFLRTRWGRLRLPAMAIDFLEPVAANGIDSKLFVPAGAALQAAPVRLEDFKSDAVETWFPHELADDPNALAGYRHATFDKAPDPKGPLGKGNKAIAVKAGDNVGDAYKHWGALLRSERENGAVKAAADVIRSPSQGNSLKVAGPAIAVNFIVPGAGNEARTGGVHVLGAWLPDDEPGSMALEVFDRNGRRIGHVDGSAPQIIPGVGVAALPNFLGVRSTVPIARARFYRADGSKDDFVLDDLCFSQVLSADRPADQSAVWLSNGELLAGRLTGGDAATGLLLRPEFLDAQAAPVSITVDALERYEPARAMGGDQGRKRSGTPHGFLLQDGEAFRGRLLKLDPKDVKFELPGGVELTLPRELLRKIDLNSAPPAAGELPEPTSVRDDEKPGIDLGEDKKEKEEKDKQQARELAGEKEKDPPAKPVKSKKPVEEPEIKIVSVDPVAREIVIDDGGEWTIGYALAKSLIFPKNANAGQSQPKFREWLLTLREGSVFEVSLVGVTADAIVTEMSGGTVKFPIGVVDSIQRRKK